jgi:hypothetical protein
MRRPPVLCILMFPWHGGQHRFPVLRSLDGTAWLPAQQRHGKMLNLVVSKVPESSVYVWKRT